jgi:hypothetical protein
MAVFTKFRHHSYPKADESTRFRPIYWNLTLILFSCFADPNGPGYRSRYSDSLRVGRSWDRIPVEARFTAPVQTDPGAYPASSTMGTGSFPGVKQPGRDVDHPPPSSAEVKERVELYIYSPSGLSWPVLGRTLLFWPIPVATLSKERVCGRSIAGIASKNPAEGMDVCLLWVLCVVR